MDAIGYYLMANVMQPSVKTVYIDNSARSERKGYEKGVADVKRKFEVETEAIRNQATRTQFDMLLEKEKTIQILQNMLPVPSDSMSSLAARNPIFRAIHEKSEKELINYIAKNEAVLKLLTQYAKELGISKEQLNADISKSVSETKSAMKNGDLPVSFDAVYKAQAEHMVDA